MMTFGVPEEHFFKNIVGKGENVGKKDKFYVLSNVLFVICKMLST